MIPDLVRRVALKLEKELATRPFDVLNESELQALLQVRLLKALPQEPNLCLAKGVVDRRPSARYKCRRVYREAKVQPGQSGREPDLVILQDRPQVILPKQNGAPSRFQTPYDAIIETKMDASPTDILSGLPGRLLKHEVLKSDVAKWKEPEEALSVMNVVYTARPDDYQRSDNTNVIKRALASQPPRAVSPEVRKNAVIAYGNSLELLFQAFKEQPYRFLREKDFETALFAAMRDAVTVKPDEFHPVRTQYWMDWRNVIQRRRRHDLVVLGECDDQLALEIELKTSHSDQHNWFRTSALKKEFEAIHMLSEHGHLGKGVFLLFRYGSARWQNDAAAACAKYPRVNLDYRCAEQLPELH